jgi:hypothetical protein
MASRVGSPASGYLDSCDPPGRVTCTGQRAKTGSPIALRELNLLSTNINSYIDIYI